MCPELQPGCRAAGHLLGYHILPGLGLDDGTLWRPGVGGALSYQRPSQQKLVLDQMVRNVLFQFLLPWCAPSLSKDGQITGLNDTAKDVINKAIAELVY